MNISKIFIVKGQNGGDHGPKWFALLYYAVYIVTIYIFICTCINCVTKS